MTEQSLSGDMASGWLVTAVTAAADTAVVKGRETG